MPQDIQPKCFDIIRRELWCYICMVLLVAWDSEHDTTTPRYRLIFTCQHTHPYYSCLIPLSPISNELLWKQKQINKKPMACLFSIKSVSVLRILDLSYMSHSFMNKLIPRFKEFSSTFSDQKSEKIPCYMLILLIRRTPNSS